MDPPTDAAIIRRSLAEPLAFEVVFERHYDAVRLYAQRLVGASDGEDIAAQAFEVAFSRRAAFDGEGYDSAIPWLIGIAHNLALHVFRQRRMDRERGKRLPAERDPEIEFNEDALDAWRLRPILRSALAVLREEDRETFLLFALSDLNAREIALLLGIPHGTVRSRVNRSRAALREHFGARAARGFEDEE